MAEICKPIKAKQEQQRQQRIAEEEEKKKKEAEQAAKKKEEEQEKQKGNVINNENRQTYIRGSVRNALTILDLFCVLFEAYDMICSIYHSWCNFRVFII